jgi:ATP phosphoribosyltransferase regulatory subunit
VTNVFRHAHVAGVLQREFWQAGVELIGLVSLEADVEMIAIAVECLEQNGVENIRMSLSHSAFIRGLLDELRLKEGERDELLDAVSRRDASGLESLIAKLPSKAGDAHVFLELPDLFGGKEVLAKASKKVKNATSKKAVEELGQVQRMLEMYGLADRVIFDLSDFRDFDYYTGVLFEGFVEGSGYPVCGGGRYDRLVGRYGTDALGTGIAIDLDELLRVAPEDEMNGLVADFLVIDSTREKRIGITLARELRSLGWRVARDIIRRDLADSLEYARRAGVTRCLVVDRDGKNPGRIRILEPAGKEIGGFSLEDLPGKIGRREERE